MRHPCRENAQRSEFFGLDKLLFAVAEFLGHGGDGRDDGAQLIVGLKPFYLFKIAPRHAFRLFLSFPQRSENLLRNKVPHEKGGKKDSPERKEQYTLGAQDDIIHPPSLKVRDRIGKFLQLLALGPEPQL